MLTITKLNSGYGDLQVLKDISLEIQAGSISVLMGPNGAGKSTLLKSIFNLLKIDSGEIKYKGEDITSLSTHKLLSLGLAYVPQGKINFDILTVEENLFLGSILVSKDEKRANLEKVYTQFPVLNEKKDMRAFTLSGGQQQMLALGRALINLPKLMLLDEPTLGLSPKLVKEIFSILNKINKNFGVTLLIVEHNIKSLLDIADFGFVMSGGKLLASGPSQELKTNDIMKKVFVGEFE